MCIYEAFEKKYNMQTKGQKCLNMHLIIAPKRSKMASKIALKCLNMAKNYQLDGGKLLVLLIFEKLNILTLFLVRNAQNTSNVRTFVRKSENSLKFYVFCAFPTPKK